MCNMQTRVYSWFNGLKSISLPDGPLLECLEESMQQNEVNGCWWNDWLRESVRCR